MTAVGGTFLPPGGDATKDEEVAVTRFPSGGGFSNIYPIPDYQARAWVQKRKCPGICKACLFRMKTDLRNDDMWDLEQLAIDTAVAQALSTLEPFPIPTSSTPTA